MSEGQSQQDARHSGVIAPPPLIFLFYLGCGFLIDWVLDDPPRLNAPDWARVVVPLFFALLAFVLLYGAIRGFHRAGTPTRPWVPTSAIVETGVYRFTRNPMYLGMAFVFAAIAIIANSVFVLVMLIPALIFIEFGVIRREERYLEAKFGADYLRYKASVRRWI